MSDTSARLILVYNADGGLLNMLKDGLHKLIRPATYPCSLCALTYGPVAMRNAWRRFLDGLPLIKTFHHRDDFALAFPALDVALPVILLEQSGKAPRVLISAAELDGLPDLAALIALVGLRLGAQRALDDGSIQHRSAPPAFAAAAKRFASGASRRIRMTPLAVGLMIAPAWGLLPGASKRTATGVPVPRKVTKLSVRASKNDTDW